MSLFDKNLVTNPLPLPKCEDVGVYTNDDLYNRIQGLQKLSSLEYKKLHKFYKCNLSGDGLFRFIEVLLSRGEIQVIISDYQPSFSEETGYDWDHPVDPYQTKDGKIIILGEYIRNKNEREEINLYYTNIRRASRENKINSSLLLLSVFAHELYHAFFNKSCYCPCLEEPMAEFGSLLYMNALRKTNVVSEGNIRALYDMIIKKKGGLKCYSIGAELFSHTINDTKTPRMIEQFKSFDLTLLKTSKTTAFETYKKSLKMEELISLLA